MNKNGQPAAFYDLEGTLVSTNLVHTLAFYAKRQQGLWQTAKKSVGTLARLPFFGVADLYSRNVFNEVFFKSYAGFSHDRLRYFSDELFEEVLKPAIFPGTFDLIAKGKKDRPAADRYYRCFGFYDRTADGLSRYRRLQSEPYGVRQWLFDGPHNSASDAPATKAQGSASTPNVRISIFFSDSYAYSFDLGFADAFDSRASCCRCVLISD